MDAAPSFGVTMISEVPSNPQLTLVANDSGSYVSKYSTLEYLDIPSLLKFDQVLLSI